MSIKSLLIYYLSAAAGISTLTSCQKEIPYTEISGMAWNTVYHMTIQSETDLTDSITATMRAVEMSLSPFDPASAISAINRGESDSIDLRIAKVMEESQRINLLSGGSFDPTVAPLINLWGFGYKDGEKMPPQSAIDSCMRNVGICDCRIEGGRLFKKTAATEFNFSAITKGLGCDEVAAMLRRNGCSNYMIEIGGEMALGGVNPHGEPWKVMVAVPDEKAMYREGMAVIEATECGIATSGNYLNYRDTPQGRIGHTISPLTGKPVATSTLSVTVIAPSAMTADAIATACMAMPLDEAVSMIESQEGKVSALFIVAQEDGTTTMVRAGGFPE